MRIALWDIDLFNDSREQFSDSGWNVVLAPPGDCGEELLKGNVDVALVPSVEVLKNTHAYSILPSVGFASAAGFSDLTLCLHRPLNEIGTIRCDHDSEPFFDLVSVILREQYGNGASRLTKSEADADLIFGRKASCGSEDQQVDVGQEWFEMTGRPLAWGFFAARPGTPADSATTNVQQILGTVLRGDADDRKANDERPRSSLASLHTSYDPEVAEGIDELTHYLFYFSVLDDIPALRLMAATE